MEVLVVLSQCKLDPASATLPRQEEEPRELSYAAAEVFSSLGILVEAQNAKARGTLLVPTGGGRRLRMWGWGRVNTT